MGFILPQQGNVHLVSTNFSLVLLAALAADAELQHSDGGGGRTDSQCTGETQ